MLTDEQLTRIEDVVEAFRLNHGIPDDVCPDMMDLLMRMRIKGTIAQFDIQDTKDEIGHPLADHEARRFRRADGKAQFGAKVSRDEEVANAIASALLSGSSTESPSTSLPVATRNSTPTAYSSAFTPGEAG